MRYWYGSLGDELKGDSVLNCRGRHPYCRSSHDDDGEVDVFQKGVQTTAMAMTAVSQGSEAPTSTSGSALHPLDALADKVNHCIQEELEKMEHPPGLGPRNVHVITSEHGWFFRYITPGTGKNYRYLYPSERRGLRRLLTPLARWVERKPVRDRRDHALAEQ